jgi:hypothetical protein
MLQKTGRSSLAIKVFGNIAVWRSGGFTPPGSEVNSPLQIHIETVPGA